MAKKSAAQLDREISEALSGSRRVVDGAHRIAAIAAMKQESKPHRVPHRTAPLTAQQKKFVDLLNQKTDEARAIARDILLENGIIHTGTVDSVRPTVDSSSGPIYQIGIVMGEGGRVGENDPKRFWMVGPADVPEVGGVLDFMVTDGSPPTRKATYAPKKQLHPMSNARGLSGNGILENYPEASIRKWIAKWWH